MTLASFVSNLVGYLNQALYLLMAAAVVTFVWYIIQYYIKPNEERAKAGQYVLWAIIGFFVVLSVWGFVNILTNTLGLDNGPRTWNELSSLFPGSNSHGASSFNEGVTPYTSMYQSNTPNGSVGYAPNIFGRSTPNKTTKKTNVTLAKSRTAKPRTAASSANKKTKAAQISTKGKGACSKYFGACIGPSSGAKGIILKNGPQDFDLLDQKDGLMIALMHSRSISFKRSGTPLATVTFLGQKVLAYKRTAQGKIYIITGSPAGNADLIVLLISKKDIPTPRAVALIGSITFK
jgi:hypothetical protein